MPILFRVALVIDSHLDGRGEMSVRRRQCLVLMNVSATAHFEQLANWLCRVGISKALRIDVREPFNEESG